MAKTTIITGLILVLIGALGYLGSSPSEPDSNAKTSESTATSDIATSENAAEGQAVAKKESKGRSVTALIPAFLGIPLLLCGLVAMKESARKHAMHAAATLGLLGFLAGAGRGAMGIGKFVSDDPSLNQRSFLFVWLMAIVCAVFVFLCIQSFRSARAAQKAGADQAS